MRKVLYIFGTRPEAIKLAPLILKTGDSHHLRPVVCLTAQHREMVDQVIELFRLPTHHDLNIMRANQTLAGLTSRLTQVLDDVIKKEKPAVVVVQGDTTSTFCGALAAFYNRVPVAHVEAGLRTGNLREPFPEEMNRVLVTRLARWHFAPTQSNADNLLKESVPAQQVHVTGNTVIDALLRVSESIRGNHCTEATRQLVEELPDNYILVTGHRRESFGAGFENICKALRSLALANPSLHIIYPVHLNPNVREPVQRLLGDVSNIRLIEPAAYEPFVALMQNARFVITDSGGVQEEAPSLGKPVLVMRNTTERTEAVGLGVELVGTRTETILAAAQALLDDPAHYSRMARAQNPYGDGHASERILKVLDTES